MTQSTLSFVAYRPRIGEEDGHVAIFPSRRTDFVPMSKMRRMHRLHRDVSVNKIRSRARLTEKIQEVGLNKGEIGLRNDKLPSWKSNRYIYRKRSGFYEVRLVNTKSTRSRGFKSRYFFKDICHNKEAARCMRTRAFIKREIANTELVWFPLFV